MRALVFLLKLLLKIVAAPVILALTLFVWICVGIVYISGLVLGLISMVIALLGVAVLLTCSLQNGIILLVMAFLISPFGLPMAAIWLLGKVQDLKFAIQDLVFPTLCLLYLIIFTVICFTCCAGKAKVTAGDSTSGRPNRRTTDRTSCTVFLGGKRFSQCFYKFFFMIPLVVLHYHIGKFFYGHRLHHLTIPPGTVMYF